jgi:Nif-specific regulatory protein
MGSRTISFERHPMLDLKQRALLFEVLGELSGRIDLDELLRIIVGKAKEVLDAESAAILLWDTDSDELYFPYIDDVETDVENRFRQVRFPADRGIAGWVLRSGEPELVLDVRKDPRWYGDVDRKSGMKTMSLLCAPLRGRLGRIGVIQLRNKRSGEFTRVDLELLDALAASAAGAIEGARAYGDAQRSKEKLQAQIVALQQTGDHGERFGEIVGNSPAMERVFRLMESALAPPIAVLLQGDTGTGKELIARALHEEGPRSHQPFVAIDCGGLQETLVESLLFGHRKGSFTGAYEDRHGFFEVADGGTIFLDEIGDMPLGLQVKLLRVLQERKITRVGDTAPIPVDVRVISATRVDLEAACRQGTFREDLYFRLSAFPIRVPPLRERASDIPALANRLLQRASARYAKPVAGFSPEVLRRFADYEWPGNVRELQNEIERALTLVRSGETITPHELSMRLGGPDADPEPAVLPPAISLKDALESFEREFLRSQLARHGGNVSETAAALGISRTGMHNKMRLHGLVRREP